MKCRGNRNVHLQTSKQRVCFLSLRVAAKTFKINFGEDISSVLFLKEIALLMGMFAITMGVSLVDMRERII